MHCGSGDAGIEKTARLFSIRNSVHTGTSAWCPDGLLRGRMCGILSLWKDTALKRYLIWNYGVKTSER